MYYLRHADGGYEDNPPLALLSLLYDELATTDQEHGDVSVVNEDNGWCMSAHRNGQLVFGKLGDRNDCHMLDVSKDRTIKLWIRLINGDINGILKEEPWRPGY
jgi:hypothetical protein